MLHKQYYIAVYALLFLLLSCGSPNNGKEADDKTTNEVTTMIDSIIASEPDISISSLSVVKAPMPSVMADEVKPALEESSKMLAAFIFAQALGGKQSSDDKKLMEDFVAMGAPLREAMKKYESETHPNFVFGLVKLTNSQDSTKNERRVYIFNEDNLKEVKRVEKFKSKSSSDAALLFGLAYGDQIDYSNKDLKPEDIKVVHDNPILKFIAEE